LRWSPRASKMWRLTHINLLDQTLEGFKHKSRSVQNREELARRLSAVLDQREEEILKKLNTNSKFVWLARNIDKEHINYVRGIIRDTQNQNAVGVQEDYKRVYPHGYLASNLIGFVGADGRGLEGIEYMFDHKLYSKEAKKVFLYSPKGGRLVLNLEEEERDYKTRLWRRDT
jgi:cell division protein FtsI (penicillin-binding protein 3)